jgi:hypothetical protein
MVSYFLPSRSARGAAPLSGSDSRK